ncbi:FeoB small GTPase domain-containing protein [Geminocystis herdmanii]|uniref:FeoB small GTPase domain-containing protein n=1 Tax=Geminocystis herdmanii TaxID=669359 RepID=UPI0003494057|nr:FeoB small GTPase domain-containing protein [Geminocystis herdmanii]
MKSHKYTNSSNSSGSRNNWLKSLFNKPSTPTTEKKATTEIALVGMPNMGKSVLFNALTGVYVTDENHFSTTMEKSREKCKIEDNNFLSLITPECAPYYRLPKKKK